MNFNHNCRNNYYWSDVRLNIGQVSRANLACGEQRSSAIAACRPERPRPRVAHDFRPGTGQQRASDRLVNVASEHAWHSKNTRKSS